MRITQISNCDGKEFLLSMKARKEHISITDADTWLGAYSDEGVLVGVISKISIGRKTRIKEFYVAPAMRGRGIGSALLKALMDMCPGHPFSAFATGASRPLFLKAGFRLQREGKISFLTYESE